MLGTSTLFAFISFVALAVVLMERLKFLIPFRPLIFHTYGQDIGAYALVLFLNVFAFFFAVFRHFRLKQTGQKLLHLDKQVKTGQSALSHEIAEKYEE